MILTKYAKKEWGLITVVSWILILLCIAAGIIGIPAGYILAILFFLVWIVLISFFRDPERKISDNDLELLSPADGVVRDIELISATDYEQLAGIFEGKDMLRIGIFLSVFDVHINRAPCRFSVKLREHKEGMYYDAKDPRAGKENESMLLAGTASAGENEFPIGIKQIAGAVTRRIVCEPVPGDMLQRGERYGMIKYGSRVEIFLPAKSDLLEIKVRVGERVIAGTTVLAEFSKKNKE